MQSLESYIGEFEKAASHGDWDAIAGLQADLKAVVEFAARSAVSEQEQQAFLTSIKRLSELVQSAVVSATHARHQVADQLRQFSRGQAAAAEYSDQSRR